MPETVSVILPTRNRRAETLSTIETVLSSTHEDLLLHVFDNNSSDGTRDAVLSLDDERIQYRRSDTDLAVTDSFEAAYSCARGDWVAGLGADDGMAPSAIEEMLRLATESGAEAVSSAHASFHWPGVTAHVGGNFSLRHVVPDTVMSSEAAIRGVLTNQLKFQDLPTAYKSGIARGSLLKRIYDRHGRLFDSLNPDIFLGFAVARQTPVFVRSGRPLTISGTSPKSTGWNTLGDGTDGDQAREFTVLNRQSDVALETGFSHVGSDLPRHMVLMNLEAYLKATPHPSGVERILCSGVWQLAVVLSDSRRLSPETLHWAKRYARAHETDLMSRTRWAASRVLARTLSRYGTITRALRPAVPLESVHLALDEASDAVKIARTAKAVVIVPAPSTVAEASRVLGVALEIDRRSRSGT